MKEKLFFWAIIFSSVSTFLWIAGIEYGDNVLLWIAGVMTLIAMMLWICLSDYDILNL